MERRGFYRKQRAGATAREIPLAFRAGIGIMGRVGGATSRTTEENLSMFRLVSSFDNSIQVAIRGKKTLHRVYSRRYLEKIPMPTFDFGPCFCCCCPSFVSRTESCDVFIEKGCWPIKGWLTAAPFNIHDAVLVHASFWERFPQEAKSQFNTGAVFDDAGNSLQD